jgi:hypothetical protein
MKQIIASLLALVLVTACAPNSILSPVGMNSAPNQISFIDADAFDASLENALNQQPETVTVTPPSGASVTNLPPRLGRWLTAVARANGQVSVAEMKTQASFMVDILSGAYGQYQQALMYQSAANYNVILHQKAAGDSTLEKIVFVRKGTAQ